jgi:hypothetical protein
MNRAIIYNVFKKNFFFEKSYTISFPFLYEFFIYFFIEEKIFYNVNIKQKIKSNSTIFIYIMETFISLYFFAHGFEKNILRFISFHPLIHIKFFFQININIDFYMVKFKEIIPVFLEVSFVSVKTVIYLCFVLIL